MTAPAAPRPQPDRRRWWILAVLCLSVLLVVVDNTIVNVALPTISRKLSASTQGLQWVVDGYTLVFAGLLVVGGNIGDRLGRRRVLQAGLALFAVFSVAAALSRNTGELIAGRAAMGLAAALIYPATLALLTQVFTDERERATAIGVWSGVSGLAVAIGPVSGGLLLRHFSWSSVFLINVPIVIVALAAGLRLLPESRDPNAGRFDPLGAVLSIAGISLLVWTVIEAPVHGWGSAITISGFAGVAGHPRGVHRLAAAPSGPDARHAAVRQPEVQRRQRIDRPGLLRAVRLHLPDHPVLPGGARLRPATGRSGHAAVRHRDRRAVAGRDHADEAHRDQDRRDRGPGPDERAASWSPPARRWTPATGAGSWSPWC